jgi:cytochrome b6-f complex iron-sulfur subunit
MSDDVNKPPEKNDGVSRRDFFVKVGLGSIAVAGCGTALFGYQYLSPNVLYEPSPVVNAGKPDGYPPNSVTLDPETGIYVVRAPEGFYALAAVCTHLGCLTAWKPEQGIIACPCHGSKFRRDGTKIEGPAPRPLPWLRTWVNDDGDLMIDRSSIITERQLVRV